MWSSLTHGFICQMFLEHFDNHLTRVCVQHERCEIIQCQDESDEDNSSLLVFEESYNKLVPPISFNQANNSIIPIKINVSTRLRKVLEISELTHTIDLKLSVSRKWYDNRIFFHNLKNDFSFELG